MPRTACSFDLMKWWLFPMPMTSCEFHHICVWGDFQGHDVVLFQPASDYLPLIDEVLSCYTRFVHVLCTFEACHSIPLRDNLGNFSWLHFPEDILDVISECLKSHPRNLLAEHSFTNFHCSTKRLQAVQLEKNCSFLPVSHLQCSSKIWPNSVLTWTCYIIAILECGTRCAKFWVKVQKASGEQELSTTDSV